MTNILDPPRQTPAEEIANSVSHGLAVIAALVGIPFLIVSAARTGDAANIVGASLFSLTVLLLYLASTLHHALPSGRAKRVFLVLDHAAIYLLIAGTYTPFTLGVLRGPWGWTLFGIIWGLAALGLTLKTVGRGTHPVISTGLYLLMGWMVIIAIDPLLDRLPPAGLAWLVGGGVSYSLGVIFFALSARLKFAHFVWHLFVFGGTLCHYFAILWYAF